MDARDAMLHALGMQEAMNVLLEAVMASTGPDRAAVMERVIRERADGLADHPSEYFTAPMKALAREAARLMPQLRPSREGSRPR